MKQYIFELSKDDARLYSTLGPEEKLKSLSFFDSSKEDRGEGSFLRYLRPTRFRRGPESKNDVCDVMNEGRCLGKAVIKFGKRKLCRDCMLHYRHEERN